ncbi:MAG TPA: class I SAM-dependent methyltransferase [Patescibacteria group bacterium]|nr:class I SAM-dependent methyltransferase [Patescibacteria group bacterium]
MDKPSGESQINQYNKLSAEYSALTEIDPAKQFVQYPEALRLLGDIDGKKILDIGCGPGTFARMLSRRGADVVGYDPSIEQIKKAKQTEEQEKLGIKYFVGDRASISPEFKFDKAVSVMVLMYATDKKKLQDIFAGANEALEENGSFCSITFNPTFKRFGEVTYNRRVVRTEDGKIRVDFLDEDSNVKISANFSDFSVSDYETAAKEAGFSKIEWVKLEIVPEGKEKMGNDYWKDFENDPPYIGLVATK